MKTSEQNQAILQKLAEIKAIEDHLQTIRLEYRQQQAQISALERALEEQYRKYRLFDSEISRVLLGKYSSDRISRVERSKEQYLQTALQLSDYERISESLGELESILLNKLTTKKAIVHRLLKHSEKSRALLTSAKHPESELLEQYARAIQGKMEFITLFSDLMEEGENVLGWLQRTDRALAADQQQLKEEEAPFLQISILTSIEGLEGRLLDLEERLRSYLDKAWQRLAEWDLLFPDLDREIREMDEFQFLLIVHNASQTTQIGYLRSSISSLAGKIIYIQGQLDLQIEKAERDVLNLQEYQMDILFEE